MIPYQNIINSLDQLVPWRKAFCLVVLLIALCQILFAAGEMPVASLLNSNGTVSLNGNKTSCKLDLSGYQVRIDVEMGPVFSPTLLAPQWNIVGHGECIWDYKMAVVGNDLYVIGEININSSTEFIARWDGCEWYALGPGLNNLAFSIEADGNKVYVGGWFTDAGGNPNADGIAYWDGSAWNALGTGIGMIVDGCTAIAISGNDIYIGGNFYNVGGIPNADGIAHWDGSNWNALSSGLNGTVQAIAIAGNMVYVGGYFFVPGGSPLYHHIVSWDGSTWIDLGPGLNDNVYALATVGNDVYAGGYFTDAGGDPNGDRIARWDGSNWNSVGGGFAGWSIVHDIVIEGSDIYVGGRFYDAGGDPNADGIARWDGSSWFGFGPPLIYTPNGNGVTGIALLGSDIYVGGDLTSDPGNPDASFIARWGEPNIVITLPGILDTICQTDPPISLPTTPSGITGNWSGPGVTNNVFNPINLNGNIILTFTPDPGQCIDPVLDTINVYHLNIAISGIPNSLCVLSPPISLNNVQSGFIGNWSGPGVQNNTFNPWGLNGTITLTFTPNSGQCVIPALHNLLAIQPVSPTIAGIPASICELSAPIQLPPIQSNFAGNWSGPGVQNNTFNPTGLIGQIILTFTPDDGLCALEASTTITVDEFTTPWITGIPNSICGVSAPILLPTSQGNILGTWTGPGISYNSFDPEGQNGNVTLTFSPFTDQCAEMAFTEILVEQAAVPIITSLPDSICQIDLPVSLPTTPSNIIGNWSGPGIVSNTFFPLQQSGTITLTFIPDTGQCAEIVTLTIDVNSAISPLITGVDSSVCQTGPLLVLPAIQENILGNWSGAGISNNVFNPSGLSGEIVLTFTPDSAQCAVNATTPIIIHGAPAISNLAEDCDTVSQTYTISFDIIGGDSTSYSVNGDSILGTSFVSASFPKDSMNYSFLIDDAYGCEAAAINGSVSCFCPKSSGNMNFVNTPLLICDSMGFAVVHDGLEQLGPGDVLEFVLHDQSGTSLGTIYLISTSLYFSYPAGVIPGQLYYVSAVVGENNGSGEVNLSDPCLSVSPGIPVIFYELQANISAGGSICQHECFTYNLQLSGVPPFTLSYQVNVNGNLFNDTITTDTNFANITICPSDYGIISGNMDLVLISLTDVNCNISLSPTSGTAIIVHPDVITHFNRLFCDGESVIINTILYDQSHPSGTEIFPNGSVFGCDSLVNISLSFYPPVVFDLNQTLCFGNSLPINGTVYDELNPVGTETILNGSVHGCDSIINIHLEFDSIVTTELALTLCSGEAVVIHGTTYDENHPSGSELFGSVLGCDSLVNINLTFSPPSSFELKDTLCKDESLIVNGIVYDYLNPTGTEILSHGSTSGCDSMISVNLSFYPDAMTTIDDTLDKGETLVINGSTYNQMNPTGTELIPNGSIHGCDSVIVVNLHFKSNVLTVDFNVKQPVCYGGYATIQLNSILGGIHSYWVHVDEFPDIPVDHFPYIIGDFYEGFHFLVIQDAEGLAEKYEVIFKVHELPPLLVDAGPDQSLMQNQDAILLAQASSSNVTWSWWPPDFLTCTDCPDPVVLQPTHNIFYTVQVTDKNGCTATDVIWIKVDTEYDIYFPNIFSPNGDGVNDIVFLNSHANVRIIKSFKIFDRWGGVLFQQTNFLPNDPNFGWDGTSDGKDLNPGVYVWVAEVEFEDGNTKRFSAEVTLIR